MMREKIDQVIERCRLQFDGAVPHSIVISHVAMEQLLSEFQQFHLTPVTMTTVLNYKSTRITIQLPPYNGLAWEVIAWQVIPNSAFL